MNMKGMMPDSSVPDFRWLRAEWRPSKVAFAVVVIDQWSRSSSLLRHELICTITNHSKYFNMIDLSVWQIILLFLGTGTRNKF